MLLLVEVGLDILKGGGILDDITTIYPDGYCVSNIAITTLGTANGYEVFASEAVGKQLEHILDTGQGDRYLLLSGFTHLLTEEVHLAPEVVPLRSIAKIGYKKSYLCIVKDKDLIQMDRNRNNMRFVEMENQLKAKGEYISFIQGELEKVNSEFEVAIEEKVKERVDHIIPKL